jgi:hypothetical protein
LMLATTIHESNTTPHHQAGQQHASHPTQGPGNHGPVVSGPNSVLGSINRDPAPTRIVETPSDRSVRRQYAPDPHPLQATGPSHESSRTR